MYEPAGVNAVVAIVIVEVPMNPGATGKSVELNATVRPAAVGAVEDDNVTVPVRPRLVSVAVDVAVPLARNVFGLGVDAEIVRSLLTVIVSVRV